MSSVTTTTSTLSSAELDDSLRVIEVKPGLNFSLQSLRDMLPDTETVLFFGKVFELDYHQLSELLGLVLNSTVAQALFNEGGLHSTDLQTYAISVCPPGASKGKLKFKPDVPKGEILPEVWKSMQIEVADSIVTVARKLKDVVGLMPGKKGSMVFQSMMKMNRLRPTIGTHQAAIHHAPVKENLLILDVSSSMSRATIETIVDDVVAMAYLANMHLVIVSNTATHWEPGTFDSSSVLDEAEFGGTHYETLFNVLSRDWGVVVCVADYDSSVAAKDHLARTASGHIDLMLDVSLVNRPTYLAECVGQFAAEARPLLVANTPRVLGSNSYGW